MASSRGGMALAAAMLGMLSLSVAGSISASASAACKAISKGSAETQIFPEAALNGDYFTAKNHYWSAANADSTPACVVFPTNAQEVSSVVRILQNYTTVDFAMKSGGHNPNVGWSSTDGGVLISFSKLASTTYNSKDQTAEVGTGSRWGQAATALDPYNVTVVGGRLGDVGIGGLVLGCGLSFLSAQYGLPCDSVVNYEVVLPDASIINANANSNSDLFWALKGGGNQFGIVTKFTMKTFPIGQIWGGTRIYSADKAEALINATHDLVSDYDPRAAVIVTGESTIDTLVDIFVVFFFYNAETPGKALDAFNAIEPLVDNVKVQSYADMVNANSEFSLYGFRYLIRGTTLPNLPSTQGRDLFNTHYKMWFNYVKPHALLSLLNAGFVFSIAYQPMPAVIPSASAKINPAGNTLGLDAKYGDHIWMEYDISWLSSIHDDEAHAMAMNITAAINDYAKSTYAGVKNTNYKEGDVMDEEYNPTFLNDAMYDQKPLQSYGNGNYNKMKAIQRKYDPHGFFPGRTGGFKFT